MTDYEYNKFKYRMNYDIKRFDYLVEENKIDDILKYLKDNHIKNDGAYVFAECFSIVVYTNEIHNKIIMKNYAFA